MGHRRWLCLVFVALTACGKLLAIDEEATPPAASADAGDSDAARDGAAADAQGSADGGCAARFCCNFDSPDGGCAWADEQNDDAGFTFFGPSTSQANSPPRSLEALTDNSSFKDAAHFLVYALPALVETAIHFKVLVKQNVGTSSIHPLQVKCDSQNLAVKLKAGAGGALQLGGEAVGGELDIAATYPIGTWFGVDLAVRVPAPGTALFVGTSDLPGSVPQSSNQVACASPQLRFGGLVSGTGLYEIYIDDIVIE